MSHEMDDEIRTVGVLAAVAWIGSIIFGALVICAVVWSLGVLWMGWR